MRRNFRSFLLIVILLLAIGFIALAVLKVSEKAGKKIFEGDEFVRSADYGSARKSYSEAVRIWPLIKFDKAYKERIYFIDHTNDYLTNSPAVIIYLRDNALQIEVDDLIAKLKDLNGVNKAEYITKDENFERFQSEIDTKSKERQYEKVTAEDMSNTVEVYVTNVEVINDVRRTAEISNVVDSVEVASSF